ncbi:hypothetical protein CC1G_15447 [Coprinopsis cinerea okayama7|uniref:RING-type domain-containing protein n=1 Tax=Coprinopsis cinerea (strain Okayama-7 / 130 / ATCC MYA-4618 / FGSC 9003) TaxID=240176 RepID=D6RQU9_COPC7|nr:hypothetical protein CC1G_15447 [Coprinopsis cinerea okayama7\|eukprot:XP_002910170.1 hypothetical protein CC1G_15447 [Coprinopsis cinerea okayama7\
MLVAGSTSACDVCLEPFGGDSKAPCTITCGHVFCVDCLANINPPLCPLCRKIFDPRFTVKLHLDLDNVRAPPSPNGASAPNDDDARRLYQAISNIAEAGCSETQVRQLISEGKSFLQKQPKDSFKDLRTLYRMVAYLCEVKTTLRAQNAANEALKREHAQLQAEKNELVAKIEQQLRVREQERQAAWATESSLRDHCTKAHEAYETMVQQVSYDLPSPEALD